MRILKEYHCWSRRYNLVSAYFRKRKLDLHRNSSTSIPRTKKPRGRILDTHASDSHSLRSWDHAPQCGRPIVCRGLETTFHPLKQLIVSNTYNFSATTGNSGNSTDIRTVPYGYNVVPGQRRLRWQRWKLYIHQYGPIWTQIRPRSSRPCHGIPIGMIHSYWFPCGGVDADKNNIRSRGFGSRLSWRTDTRGYVFNATTQWGLIGLASCGSSQRSRGGSGAGACTL